MAISQGTFSGPPHLPTQELIHRCSPFLTQGLLRGGETPSLPPGAIFVSSYKPTLSLGDWHRMTTPFKGVHGYSQNHGTHPVNSGLVYRFTHTNIHSPTTATGESCSYHTLSTGGSWRNTIPLLSGFGGGRRWVRKPVAPLYNWERSQHRSGLLKSCEERDLNKGLRETVMCDPGQPSFLPQRPAVSILWISPAQANFPRTCSSLLEH